MDNNQCRKQARLLIFEVGSWWWWCRTTTNVKNEHRHSFSALMVGSGGRWEPRSCGGQQKKMWGMTLLATLLEMDGDTSGRGSNPLCSRWNAFVRWWEGCTLLCSHRNARKRVGRELNPPHSRWKAWKRVKRGLNPSCSHWICLERGREGLYPPQLLKPIKIR